MVQLRHVAISSAFLLFACGGTTPTGASVATPQPAPAAGTEAHAQSAPATDPHADRDGDRILDVCDECINEPEVYNGHEDLDGCPDRGDVLLIDNQVRILEKIYFERGLDRPAAQSTPVLDAVAATISGNPELELIGIVGHADTRERDAHALARRRAEAVRDALVAHGVDAARLSVFESGSGVPAEAAGESAADRAVANRRVEFAIMRTAEREMARWSGTTMELIGALEAARAAPPLEMHRVPLSEAARRACDASAGQRAD